MSGFSEQTGNRWRSTRSGPTLHVTVEHRSGSLQHYYHFLLGFFVPLLYHLSAARAGHFDHLLVRSCGPLDRMIAELGDPRIRVLDPEQHRHVARLAAGASSNASVLRTSPGRMWLEAATILGLDDPAAYDRATFTLVRNALGRVKQVQDQVRRVEEVWPPGDPRILMIDRGPGLPFYHSDESEVKGSGNERRSIPNFSAIYQSVRCNHGASISIMTETLSLARQFALFATADIIIAQHGAALANMIWARPRATIIEIFPDDVRANLFRDLAWCLGLRYRRFRQRDSHADIDPDELAAFADEAVDHRSNFITSQLRPMSFRALRRMTMAQARVRSFSRRVKRFEYWSG